jgi:hypothetical protein
VDPLTRGLPPLDPRSLCPLSSTEFVGPSPSQKKIPESTTVNDLYYSPTIVRVINSRRMILAVCVARMGEGRGVYRVLVGKHERKQHIWKSQS